MAATAASLDAGKLRAHSQRSANHDHPNPQRDRLPIVHHEISNNYSEDDPVQTTEQKGNQGNLQRDAIPTVVGRKITFMTRIFNDLMTCKLCAGYFVDATTVHPCLHTFCKSCIYKHWKRQHDNDKCCPACMHPLGPNPLQHLKPDPSMQNIAYKLVPHLQEREQELIRTFEKSQEVRVRKRTSAGSVRSSNTQPAKKHSKVTDGCLSTATRPATAASPSSSPAVGPETLVAFALELDTEWFNMRKYENVSRGQARLADPCLKTKARATIGQVGKHLRKRLAIKPAKVDILHNGSKLDPEWTLGNVAASDPIQPLIFRYRPWYNTDT
ncbi:uncharacterized protein SPPG_02046 [Spizellomyces punctatus DAOM BR117]|uniref:RING-type domain-containing protein n=1 Tax=Spizellomyces punctatus (strain DAOM BR117) TaxID=645134 RepID=A0A0L0HNG2_SPIPD|nr:uncharacterized protein SPPG_02046 [Spizellomyces punctatus DAOM BR117]KND02971.1 hypothetical protein SPPG_02046 [Spizellomyces punctatus DAOM BR117]|eukprot:XP_016611010.1 hypothetical protein SPPG_02046 [Spizellomyces punctatus DAOM BR117]